jgi:uncharacterized protein YecE (DUF72 family)
MTVCKADWPEFGLPIPEEFSFEYVRRHGPYSGSLYAGCYTEKQLKADAEMIKQWKGQGKDVFIYFNNDAEGWAVKNALRLKQLI